MTRPAHRDLPAPSEQESAIPEPSEQTLIETAHDLLDVVDEQTDLTHGERLELLTRANVSAALATYAALDRLGRSDA